MDKIKVIEEFLDYKNGEFKEIKDKYNEALEHYNELKDNVVALLGKSKTKKVGKYKLISKVQKRYNVGKILKDYMPYINLSNDYYDEKVILSIEETIVDDKTKDTEWLTKQLESIRRGINTTTKKV